jgi:hypothetical protein
MSDTIVDMPKVAQMLDSGWEVRIYLGPLGSYEVRAAHPKDRVFRATLVRLSAFHSENAVVAVPFDAEFHVDDGWLMTDDFTPEQALTRMAYKVHGEII